jgi:hypothetical protein
MRLLGGDADAVEAAKEAAKVYPLDLAYISPYLTYIFHISPSYLPYISAIPPPYLPYTSPISPLDLP